MGACASVPKAMRGEAKNVPAPEPREEETSAAAAAVEETAAEKAEVGNHNNQNEAPKVEIPKEPSEILVTNKSEIEEPMPPVPPAALEEAKKTSAAEQKS